MRWYRDNSTRGAACAASVGITSAGTPSVVITLRVMRLYHGTLHALHTSCNPLRGLNLTRSVRATLLAASVLLAATLAQAFTIDWVPIGNPGNNNDDTGYGGVAYAYQISKYEVTNTQYVEFLNAVDSKGTNALGLYNSNMSSNAEAGGINFTSSNANGSKYSVQTGEGNLPVTFVSWYDSIRFANWMHNGQGPGNTEDGAYTLLGGTPTPSNGLSITRNVGASVFLTSENEWYKAAYYNGGANSYVDYPTGTSVVPNSDQPPGDVSIQSNVGNFYRDDSLSNGYNDGYAVTGSTSYSSSQNYLTDVGAYTGAPSLYGTFDQGGNVWEWNEALISGSFRGLRGSSWYSYSNSLAASCRGLNIPPVRVRQCGLPPGNRP